MTDQEKAHEDEGDPIEEKPERSDEANEPSKGSGPKEEVQPKPEDQRGRPDPKYKDSLPGD